MPERVFAPEVHPDRARLIIITGNKWVNGTVLHYYFFDRDTDGETVILQNGTQEWRPWATPSDAEKNVVREAFDAWKGLGIGLSFEEVDAREEAEIRIGFMRGDGAWSYIGRRVLDFGPNERTMNFGWDLTRRPDEIDTAIHEIGHTLGFPHEHQNPKAGIVWNEEAVYAALAAPPNNWDRETTYYNIIRKLERELVEGSNWDPNSVMHYPFEAGLIERPEEYQAGLQPAGGLSAADRDMVKRFYPPLAQDDYRKLQVFESARLSLGPGEQANFLIEPDATRYYEIRTFGASDAVIVLFEYENGDLRYRTADDDSGEDRNAYLKTKLMRGHRYVLRVRLYYGSGETAVMLW
jgi:hypothetical protein